MSALSVILTPFEKLILLFYSITGSYGVSLLLFALVIRLILFPVFLKGRKSMLSMSGLAEKQQELAKKYARNREKYSQELAKLYEEEGVKPSGGCLVVLPAHALFDGAVFGGPATSDLSVGDEPGPVQCCVQSSLRKCSGLLQRAAADGPRMSSCATTRSSRPSRSCLTCPSSTLPSWG